MEKAERGTRYVKDNNIPGGDGRVVGGEAWSGGYQVLGDERRDALLGRWVGGYSCVRIYLGRKGRKFMYEDTR